MKGSYLDTQLRHLPSLDEKKAKKLNDELGLRTYRDLLYHFPFRFVDRTKLYQIKDLWGECEEVQLKGTLLSYELIGTKYRSRLVAQFYDGTGTVELVWFSRVMVIPKIFPQGQQYILFGKPNRYNNTYSFSHPDLTPINQQEKVMGTLMGVYHTTSKMKRAFLDSRNLRKRILDLLPIVPQYLEETLPKEMRQMLHIIPLPQAVIWGHTPKNMDQLRAAVNRLKFDELFFLRLSMERAKRERKSKFEGYQFSEVGMHFHTLYESLPFSLTQAQQRVIKEIRQDTGRGIQMNRLLHGDVGSGKTLVAAFAMMLALDNGVQCCMLAPTEILAAQHFETLNTLLEPLGIEVGLLTGSTPAKQRKILHDAIQEKRLNILVGTHAILEERVLFPTLGLAIIDEQHRFGVAQRAKLWQKNSDKLPHILIMSATPIPRTLAMTLYGDLDISVIDELPPGRKPIDTKHFFEHQEQEVYRFIATQLSAGRQAYVVFPMIEGTEESDLKNVETGYKRFCHMFGEKNITYVHGKLKSKEKQERMDSFASGKVPILLSTTVIEVGVNVPNASVMVIENANRFGLAQLHQLRGRVGRGAEKSYCLLITPSRIGSDSERRIQAMCTTNDGFKIAEEDLKLRGEGDLEGTRQSGEMTSLNLASPSKDAPLLALAARFAGHILTIDPQLEKPENEPIKKELERLYPSGQRWRNIS